MVTENLKQKLGNFLGKNTNNVVDNGQTTEGKEVCDLDTGICYTIRSRDGLIERVENEIVITSQMWGKKCKNYYSFY